MRIARIAMMAIAFCAGTASIASAQRPDSATQGGRRMGPNLLEGITLTEQQQAQVKAIMAKEKPAFQSLMLQMAQGHAQLRDLVISGGFDEAKVRELCEKAGFSSVRRVPLENPFNNLYEGKP